MIRKHLHVCECVCARVCKFAITYRPQNDKISIDGNTVMVVRGKGVSIQVFGALHWWGGADNGRSRVVETFDEITCGQRTK